MSFSKVNLLDLDLNPFKMIGKQWYLLTVGNSESYNTMTASWGQMGETWGVPTFTCMIRPSRYTYEFIEKDDYFTISFFGDEQKQALGFCGSHSGRDFDKAKETGLTPEFIDGTTTFAEANLVFICKKIYADNIESDLFLDKSKLKFYDSDPFHKLYIGEIIATYKKD